MMQTRKKVKLTYPSQKKEKREDTWNGDTRVSVGHKDQFINGKDVNKTMHEAVRGGKVSTATAYNAKWAVFEYDSDTNDTEKIKEEGETGSILNTRNTWWDAGHILANASGGKGNDPKNIFAQDPATNQGKVGYKEWVEMESDFNTLVNKSEFEELEWGVKLAHNGNYHTVADYTIEGKAVKMQDNFISYTGIPKFFRSNYGTDTNDETQKAVKEPNPLRRTSEVSVRYRSKRKGEDWGGYVTKDNISNEQHLWWDAGHILAESVGGDGTDKNNIFAQDPATNQGKQGHDTWRKNERDFKGALAKGSDAKAFGRWKVEFTGLNKQV
ncbi:DNA/RNA non-specific endonuclease [uncultured Shewanella sp.]|uniref:DNA/RNA non-specific endonuclease n=1 Tax=uncultured Shewanella sp. TaxID=173975 RepID=UPI002635D5A0|nr:DNA/RNA non-specific endonuclease [uncultured Shewanella sp.]